MAELSKVQVLFTGFLGGPAVSTFYTNTVIEDLQPFRDFYGSFVGKIPDEVTVSFPNQGITVDSVTGSLIGGWGADAETAFNGGNSGVYSSGVGAVVRWVTATVINRRLVKGRTFLVPLGGDSFDGTGQVTTSTQSVLQASADQLVDDLGSSLVVWHRPVANDNGESIPVLGAFVPRKPAILRSRRD